MMERKVLLICFVAGFLGLLSAATGFGAEGTRIKVNKLNTLSIWIFWLFSLMGFFLKNAFFLLFSSLSSSSTSPLIGC